MEIFNINSLEIWQTTVVWPTDLTDYLQNSVYLNMQQFVCNNNVHSVKFTQYF